MAPPAPSVQTPKRSVSFGPTTDDERGGRPSSVAMTPQSSADVLAGSTSAQSTPATALKPALKAGSKRNKLPSKEQYQHSDPLLRRLRLVDAAGDPVDLRTYFRHVKCVGFYFSSQWAGQPLKEYHQTINDFVRVHPNEFKVVYVSVDVDEQWYKAGIKGQPWVSMVWNDGSSLPSDRQPNSSTLKKDSSAVQDDSDDSDDALPALYNNEDFLLATEADIDESLSRSDTSGTAYLRPFSRVHLAAKLNIIAAPTLCVYHIEKQKMLDWNVRMARLGKTRRQDTWERWLRGEGPQALSFGEAMQRKPITFALCGLAILYWCLVYFGGPEYNFIRRYLDSFDRSKPPIAASNGQSSSHFDL